MATNGLITSTKLCPRLYHSMFIVHDEWQDSITQTLSIASRQPHKNILMVVNSLHSRALFCFESYSSHLQLVKGVGDTFRQFRAARTTRHNHTLDQTVIELCSQWNSKHLFITVRNCNTKEYESIILSLEVGEINAHVQTVCTRPSPPLISEGLGTRLHCCIAMATHFAPSSCSLALLQLRCKFPSLKY